MTNRNVFLYWVGKEYKLIKLLRKLIYLHSKNGTGYTVHLINETNIKEYLDILPDFFNCLLPAHQADYVRVQLVCKHGGIWLDSDTIIMHSLDSLFDLIQKKDGFFILETSIYGINICNGVFGSKANTPLMLKMKDDVHSVLNKQKIHWTEAGCGILDNIKRNNPILLANYEIINGSQNVYPITWTDCVKEFIEKPYDNYKNIIREYQPFIILVNSVYKALEDKSEDEILNGHRPLNYFIDISFKNINTNKSFEPV
jgi:hypothetical protein